jgi:hypothetical protein
MSIFEAIMLLCFGISWPLAIYKTYKSKNPAGKSMLFLYIVIIGYIAGCTHKLVFNFDLVFWLYCINLLMVITDLFLSLYYLRNVRLLVKENICIK